MNIVFAASFQGDIFTVTEANGTFVASQQADDGSKNGQVIYSGTFSNKGTAVKELLSRMNSWATDFETGAAE